MFAFRLPRKNKLQPANVQSTYEVFRHAWHFWMLPVHKLSAHLCFPFCTRDIILYTDDLHFFMCPYVSEGHRVPVSE